MVKKEKVDASRLYKAVLSLKTAEECAAFFDDICTYQEIESMVQRLEVAVLLSQGKSYIDVNKSTGASTATICRVSKALNYGDGGYGIAIERLNSDEH